MFIGGAAFGSFAGYSTRRWISPAAATAELPGQAVTAAHLRSFRARADQITDIKVCLRPFRAAGPRLDAERFGDKVVIHNYGHGGSGWSLSWGSANIAVGNAATTQQKKLAVVGCGIIGLTSALIAQRAGFEVTIYTRDLLPHTRSVRANGSWTPDSRIALTEQAGPQFPDLWEQMARYSWATYRDYLGQPGNPIMFLDNYSLSDLPSQARPEEGVDPGQPTFASTGRPQQSAEFAAWPERIKDIIPAAVPISGSDNPFPGLQVRRHSLMIYNFGAYGHLLLSEFFQAGGRVVIREFHTPADFKTIPEHTIINCPGYAARDLWNDQSLIPVRGQTAWLPPQPDIAYGLAYRGAAMLSKSDGVMVQGFDLDHLGEMTGVGNSFEHPDRTEAERAIGIFADLFDRFPAVKG
ncbi:D-amino-acid oxidase [Acetobacter oeni]|uniref:D-amino-acid oxidase n=2 Tax=Acetobacter oeni TaxID=304077 RepID=A0A511XL03_9PROT|nr:D-amino-acid oxidase [Acetobacter oeni]